MRSYATSVVLAAAAFLAACSTENAPPSHLASDADALNAKLAGSWIIDCSTTGGEPEFQRWQTVTLTFSGGKVVTESASFQDANCSTPLDKLVVESTYVLGNRIANTESYAFDLTDTKGKIGYFTDEAVAMMNANKGFSYNDWKVGELKDISNKLFAPDVPEPLVATGRTYYFAIAVDGNKLITAREYATDPANRATIGDDAQTFRRK